MRWGWLMLMASLTVGWAEERDPFAADGFEKEGWEEAQRSVNVEVIYEVFSLSLNEAAELRREFEGDGELYDTLVRRLKQRRVKQEVFQMVTGRSGEEVILEDVEEYIFPTEWEPPEGVEDPPNLLAYEEGITSISSSAFDTKDLGNSLYVTPRFWDGVDLIELKIESIRSRLVGLERWGKEPVIFPMPKFGVAGVRTRLVTRTGGVTLLGTMNEQNERVRFAFLRASKEGEPGKRGQISGSRLRYEVFSLPVDEAAAMRRKRDGALLYERMVDGLTTGKVRQERLLCVQGVSGGSAIAEQITEWIYPSAYDPPGFGHLLVEPEKTKAPRKRRFPKVTSAFETKNVGDQIEMEMNWGNDAVAQIRLVANHDAFLKRNAFGEGKGRDEMPEFAVQVLKTAMSLPEGVPALTGSVTPANEEGRIWWAFVKVSGVE